MSTDSSKDSALHDLEQLLLSMGAHERAMEDLCADLSRETKVLRGFGPSKQL